MSPAYRNATSLYLDSTQHKQNLATVSNAPEATFSYKPWTEVHRMFIFSPRHPPSPPLQGHTVDEWLRRTVTREGILREHEEQEQPHQGFGFRG